MATLSSKDASCTNITVGSGNQYFHVCLPSLCKLLDKTHRLVALNRLNGTGVME
jgi:hypothetical protein